MSEVPIIQKSVQRINEWFLYDSDLRHEKVKAINKSIRLI